MPTVDVVKLAIFVVTLGLGVTLLIFIFSLFNVPNNLPEPIVNTIDWLIAGVYSFDFILPIKLMFQLMFWSLVSSLTLYVADGALFVWKQISKLKS